MASKRAIRKKQCSRKKKYTKTEALYNAAKLTSRGMGVLDAYPCSHCGGWHIGHRPKAHQQKIDNRRRLRDR